MLNSLRPLLLASLTGAALLAPFASGAQDKRGGLIYSCEVGGRRITSDRPIAECNARDQRVLNSDGSVREVRAPVLTADERAAFEARQQEEALARAQQREAIRRDRNLLARFPTQQAHDKAREAALDVVRTSLKTSESRLAALEKERKPLVDETEFYVGKQLPLKLRQAIDANDAAADAQRDLVANQKAEIVRINRNYDEELERLRRLWSGAQPGSLGPLAVSPPASSSATR
ncbi:hypothetical protein [Piscinibacter sp.]|uniref:hypothetical protein n=1 Tax=Piscinibacter sp. TaxID=1903157 RepID=UPI0039E4313B